MTDSTQTPDTAVDTRLADVAQPLLEAHARRAESQLRELESDMAGMLGDSGTIQEDRDGTRHLIESVRADLMRTQRALDRIEAGTYGLCTACREPIASARLQAIPEAERCANCA